MTTDGVGRQHAYLKGECPRCRTRQTFAYAHLPTRQAKALERLLDCPDLNLDELEDEMRDAIREAQTTLRIPA